ncbi:MAG: sulfotransferase [Pseudomonadales bacterium]|nr:sulfotransferase [Pseudomonadales bacterium]
MNAYKKVFIVGVGRSGTSLLHSMLTSNSKIALPPETSFLRRYLIAGKVSRIYRENGLKGLKMMIETDRCFVALDNGTKKRLLSKLACRTAISDRDFYSDFLTSYAEQEGKLCFGDKDPRTVEFLPVLYNLWPDAHVIHIIRDPRDILVSKKSAKWSRHRNPLLHILANAAQLKLGRYYGKKLFGSRYHELFYEDLLAEPEQCLQTICDLLDIEFEEQMLDFSQAAKKITRHDELSWKKETFGPLLHNNQNKWLSALSPQEITICEAVCKEVMALRPYEHYTVNRSTGTYLDFKVTWDTFVLKNLTYLYCSYAKLRLWRWSKRRLPFFNAYDE